MELSQNLTLPGRLPVRAGLMVLDTCILREVNHHMPRHDGTTNKPRRPKHRGHKMKRVSRALRLLRANNTTKED